MKRFYSLIAIAIMALVSLTVSAQKVKSDKFPVSGKIQNKIESLVNMEKKTDLSAVKTMRGNKAPRKAGVAPETVLGTYIAKEGVTWSGSVDIKACAEVSIEANEDGTYTMKNLLQASDPTIEFILTYDDVNKVFAMEETPYAGETTNYGPLFLVGFDADENVVYAPEFAVNEDGTISMSNCVELDMIIAEGEYAGYSLYPMFSNISMVRPNGTMNNQLYDAQTDSYGDSKEYPIYIEMNDKSTGGTVYNFAAITEQNFTVDEEGYVEFEQTPVDYAGSSYTIKVMAAAFEDGALGGFYSSYGAYGLLDMENNTMYLGPWGVLAQSTDGKLYLYGDICSESEITWENLAIVETPVEPITDQIDFNTRDIPTTTTSNGAGPGDITEGKTFVSDKELFTATVSVSGKSTPNRIWGATAGPQLRIYGGTVTIDGKGQEIIQVKLSGAQLDNKGATRSPSYTINDLNKEEIIAAGGSISSTEAIWAGSSDKVVIEHTYSKENLQINSITVTFAPEEEPINITLGELVALEPGNEEPVEVTVAVEGAKVTATYDTGDFPIAYVEDETGAVAMVDMSGKIADLAQGKALTGTIKGAWMDYGTGAMFGIEEFNCTAEDTEIVPTEIVESNELLEASNLNRLVTVTASPMCPITNEEGQVFVGDAAQVADVYYVLGWDYEFPENIASVTGVLVNMAGSLMIMPRSAEDIVEAAAPVEAPEFAKYFWAANADGDVTEVGGMIEANEDADGRLNFRQAGYYTICLNGAKDFSTGYMTVTLDEPLKAGDIIYVTAFRNKDASNKSTGAKFRFNDDNSNTLVTGDGETFNNINPDYATGDGKPNQVAIEVTDAQEGCTKFDITRQTTGTNLFITELYIWNKDVATNINNAAVENVANGAIFNLAGQKVNANFKGIVIKNGKKILVK